MTTAIKLPHAKEEKVILDWDDTLRERDKDGQGGHMFSQHTMPGIGQTLHTLHRAVGQWNAEVCMRGRACSSKCGHSRGGKLYEPAWR